MQIPCEYSPSKVCADLSDKWDDQDSPVQRSIRTLSELVGVPVNINLEATKLWNQLQKYYPDGDTFVATITSIVRSWTEALTSRLENNDNSSWMEDFLSKVGGAVKARVEVIWYFQSSNAKSRFKAKTKYLNSDDIKLPSSDILGKRNISFRHRHTTCVTTILCCLIVF